MYWPSVMDALTYLDWLEQRDRDSSWGSWYTGTAEYERRRAEGEAQLRAGLAACRAGRKYT